MRQAGRQPERCLVRCSEAPRAHSRFSPADAKLVEGPPITSIAPHSRKFGVPHNAEPISAEVVRALASPSKAAEWDTQRSGRDAPKLRARYIPNRVATPTQAGVGGCPCTSRANPEGGNDYVSKLCVLRCERAFVADAAMTPFIARAQRTRHASLATRRRKSQLLARCANLSSPFPKIQVWGYCQVDALCWQVVVSTRAVANVSGRIRRHKLHRPPPGQPSSVTNMFVSTVLPSS